METIFTKMDNSKINEPHKFVLDLSQILDLRSSDEHIAIQNVSIYCTWKNIRKHYKKKINSKQQLHYAMMNLNYQMAYILLQKFMIINSIYIKYIIKNRETLTTILPIHVYINSINNRLVFKIKDEYKLELQMKQ